MIERICEFSELLGKSLRIISGAQKESEVILFVTSDGDVYKLYHDQDCCEDVRVDDIIGDIDDLIPQTILLAEVVSSDNTDDNNTSAKNPEYDDSYTWTFYKLTTRWGSVTIKWYGSSNGYYSEKVTFAQIATGIKEEGV